MAVDIKQVMADAQALETLWSTATAQYAERKARLAKQVDDYTAAHQGALDSHAAEIEAANLIKAKLVPVVAAAEVAAEDLTAFVLSRPWYKKAATWVKAHARWVVYGGGLALLVGVATHV